MKEKIEATKRRSNSQSYNENQAVPSDKSHDKDRLQRAKELGLSESATWEDIANAQKKQDSSVQKNKYAHLSHLSEKARIRHIERQRRETRYRS